MEKINLIGKYCIKKKSDKHDYKGDYQRLFPSKMSSSSFLTLFSLYVLKTKNEPVYGREIIYEIETMLDSSVWKPSHGTLYPILEKLEKERLVQIVKKENSRKYYTITEEGKQLLNSKLEEFKGMLMESSQFFNKVVSRMYPEI